MVIALRFINPLLYAVSDKPGFINAVDELRRRSVRHTRARSAFQRTSISNCLTCVCIM